MIIPPRCKITYLQLYAKDFYNLYICTDYVFRLKTEPIVCRRLGFALSAEPFKACTDNEKRHYRGNKILTVVRVTRLDCGELFLRVGGEHDHRLIFLKFRIHHRVARIYTRRCASRKR